MRISDWSSDVCSSDLRSDRAFPTISGHLHAGAMLSKTPGAGSPSHEYLWDIDKLIHIMPDLNIANLNTEGKQILPRQPEINTSFKFSLRKPHVHPEFPNIPLLDVERALYRKRVVS